MALRGKPRLPFYMVGRMEGQSVVLRAEKGKLRLSVDDEEDDKTQEVVYNLSDEGAIHGKDGEDKAAEAADDKPRSDGEVPGGSGGVDGAAEARGSVPGDADPVDGAGPVAEAGDRGNAPSPGAESETGQGAGPVTPPADTSGEEASADEHGSDEAGQDADEGAGGTESGDASAKGPE